MLKKRIIPTLLLKNKRLVKGKKFSNYIDTGDPVSAIKIYNSQDVDELIFININDNRFESSDLNNILSIASKNCFIPLTAGGGIRTIKQIEKLLLSGADKVIICSQFATNPNFLYEASREFGRQCMVLGIDIKKIKNEYKIFYDLSSKSVNMNIEDYIRLAENNGVGEFFINNIDCDGMMNGYDINLINKISSITSLPIISSGGAGNFNHIHELFYKTKCNGAACSSIFHFGDNNPIRAASHLRNKGIEMKKIK
jgi:cyclase